MPRFLRFFLWILQDILAKTSDGPSASVVWTSLGPLLGGYQDRLLGGPLGLPGLRYTAPEGVEHKDCGGEVLG
jgi:hypothetical protein